MTSTTGHARGSTRRDPAPRTLRRDRWWVEPLITVVVLGAFTVYATWAAFVNADYYVDPYLSPFYSPCLATSCHHATVELFGDWWTLSPALLILPFPLGFRLTCYYYRKAYYRAFFWSPPACAVPDARGTLQGGEPLPAHPPERPPAVLLPDPPVPRPAPVGRPAGLLLPRRIRNRRRDPHPPRQRRAARRLRPVLPFLSPRLRRPPRLPLDQADPVRALEVRDPAQRTAHAHRLDQHGRRGCRRPLRPAGRHRRHLRPEVLLDGRVREPRLRRGGGRRRRRRPARRRRSLRRRGPHRPGVQVVAGQGPHGHGRGGHRRCAGQRLPRRQLAGALPRHDAGRQAHQQLAHGADPRPGGARTGPRAGGVGSAVRPH